MARNYYEILGISRWASERKIKAAYRDSQRLMYSVQTQEKKLGREEAERSKAIFEQHSNEIEEAYEVLSDTQKRKQYDDFLQRAQPPSPTERHAELSRARRVRYVIWCVISGIIVVASFYFGPPSNFPRGVFYRVFMPICLMILFAKIVGAPYPEVYGWDFWDYLVLLFLVLLANLALFML